MVSSLVYNEGMSSVSTVDQFQTIPFPIADDVLFALDQEKEVFAKEARVLLAVKYYELGRLTTGLAAKMAGMSRSEFFHVLSRQAISPFGVAPDELEEDLRYALAASDLE